MSSFADDNLFGSGPHKIILDGRRVLKKRTGYAGADGVESLHLGFRGRRVRVWGQLRAASRTALDSVVEAIEDAILDGTVGTLVDVDSNPYYNIELDSITLTSPYMENRATGDVEVIVNYIVTGIQLY